MDTTQLILIIGAVLLVAVVGVVVVRSRRSKALPPATPERLSIERPTMAGRLVAARAGIGDRLRGLLGGGDLGPDAWDAIEEVLLTADVGLDVTTAVVAAVRDAHPETPEGARALIRDELLGTLSDGDRSVRLTGDPSIVLVVGVNGVGKTTTIAKLAARLREQGASPILAAADTFRAAADTQLATWAERVGVEVVRGDDGADPASVAYEGVEAARRTGADVVIVDTAGRLHSKKHLMEELGKIVRVLSREGTIDEVLLVLDGTAGQNGLAQAKAFGEVSALTGVVLTKMDGSAKGGIAFAVEHDLGVPVKFIGLGEGVDDLIPFDPVAYVDAVLEAR